MTAKEIYESIDLAQVPQDLATKLRQIEKATKGFTIQSDKIDTFLRGVYAKLKEKKPTALKNLKVEEKIVKKEVKKGKETQVVEDLEYKVKGTKNVTKKTPTPSEPKRKENPQQEAKRTRKKGETAASALTRVMEERKAAENKADSMVTKTSEALKELEQMLQSDPKLAGYPRTYGNQSKRIDAKKDAQIKAMPAGKRVSKKGHKNQYGPSKGGRVYWENRDNRSDRYAPNFPNKVFLAVGGELDDLGFPYGETYIVVDVSPSGDKKIIKSTTDYLTAMMSAAVARSAKSSKDARVLIVGKESKKVLHETFEAGGEITITPYPLVNNPDALVGTTSMTELFECGGVTAYQEGGEVFVTPYPLTDAGSADYVAGSNTMSNMFAKGGVVYLYYGGEQPDETIEAANENEAENIAMKMGAEHYDFVAGSNTMSNMFEEGGMVNPPVGTMDDVGNPTDPNVIKEMEIFIKKEIPKLDKDRFFTDGMKRKEAKRMFYQKYGYGAYNPRFSIFEKGGKTQGHNDKLDFPFEYKGFKYNVEDTGGMVDDYGRKVWQVSIQDKDGDVETTNVRGARDKEGHQEAKDFIDNELLPYYGLDNEMPKYEKGGRLGFAGLARKVAKRYEGKAVPKKHQEEYGKTYSKAESLEVGRKVAAKVYRQQQAMMEAGGEITTPYPLTNAGSAEYVAGSNTMSNMFAKGGALENKYANRAELFKVSEQYSSGKKQIVSEDYNLLQEVNKKEFNNAGSIEKYGNSSAYVLYEPRTMAKGGSLESHGLRVGDKIVEDLGYVLKGANEDGDMVYIDLANGYRGAEPPLPFEHGGGVMVGDIAGLAKKYNKSGHEVVMKIGEGEKVEMEHTENPKVARKIALDHIAEDWDYYAKLKKLGL